MREENMSKTKTNLAFTRISRWREVTWRRFCEIRRGSSPKNINVRLLEEGTALMVNVQTNKGLAATINAAIDEWERRFGEAW